jgi:2-polyprenyl-6-methoxyphenol hydroxylase-like FAD-dependent oxidoreductase
MTRGVVLGGGIAGLLAAHVLAQHLDTVVVVDRDRLPDGPVRRAGVPQAWHSHALMSRGARTLDALLPGSTRALAAAGARRVGIPDDSVVLSPGGWLRRVPGDQYFLACSRNLLEHVIRERVLAEPRITVAGGVEAVGLLGSPDAVTGVSVQDRGGGHGRSAVRDLPGDFVVDATGRGSQTSRWLRELGLPEVPQRVVDPGLAYASRLFQAPPGARHGFPMVLLQPSGDQSRPGQGGIALPIEEGRWIITLSGTRGGEPPVDEPGFNAFAQRLHHPVLAQLIAAAEPLGPVHGFRNLANRRRDYHRLPQWPTGFTVLGDAATTFNPVYGHGMSVAMLGAAALRDELVRHGGPRAGSARRVQRNVGRAAELAWRVATLQDARRPLTTGDRVPLASAVNRCVDRLNGAATRRPAAALAVADVFTLTASYSGLLSPALLWAMLRGPGRSDAGRTHAGEPPFTAAERSALRSAPIADPAATRAPAGYSHGQGQP